MLRYESMLKLPPRRLFGEQELNAVKRVFDESWNSGQDFGYAGKFEAEYMKDFCTFQGGGYADAVCSGTAALYVALKALDIKGEVVLPPVTDAGGVSPVCILDLPRVISDSEADSFNVNAEELSKAIGPNTEAVILVHVAGIPLDMDPILEVTRGLKIIEDCSHAHGAMYIGHKGKKVGTFGDVGIFSTMFSKNHASGGQGGIVYTKNEEIYKRALLHADRGKPVWKDSFKPKDPRTFELPALNLNQNEINCAIGSVTLRKLPNIIKRRVEIWNILNEGLNTRSRYMRGIRTRGNLSPFFFPVLFKGENKNQFTAELYSKGVPINPGYQFVVSEWDWVRPVRANPTPNASKFRDSSFNILFHENYTDRDVAEILEVLLETERSFL